MQVYQHEQEQVEALKQWWRKHGSLFLTVLTVTLILSVAWHFLLYRKANHQQGAAVFYQHLQKDRTQQDVADQRLLSKSLLSRYQDTLYAQYAALGVAKEDLSKKDIDAAKVSLRWVIDHSKYPGASNLARLRLARVLLMEKKPADALILLNQIDQLGDRIWPAFIRGQAFVMQGQYGLAKQAFTTAQHALWSEKKQYIYAWANQMANDRHFLNAMINSYLDQIDLHQGKQPKST
jgi:predicted negative regulator of RcsB-dependent stress response